MQDSGLNRRRVGAGNAHWRWLRFALLAGVLLASAGCFDARTEKVERGVEFARARLADVHHNAISGLAFQSNIEAGGDLLSYLAACMDEHVDYPPYYMDRPTEPWCVVLKQNPGETQVLIEGYGEDLTTPIKSATVDLVLGPPTR